jgi:hypothetical protein
MATSYNLGKALRVAAGMSAPDPKILIPESAGRDLLQERYDYIAGVLENEFEETYYRFFSCSILHYEIMNLVSVCKPAMEEFGFPYRDGNRQLGYAITAVIAEYLGEGGVDGV